MATASHPSFNACRTGATAALQWLVHQQQWREQALNLMYRRMERDRAALEGTLETLRDARDWNDFAAASQSVWRDYLSASAALWQEGAAAALQDAGAWNQLARDMTQQWQDTLTALQQGAPGVKGAAAMPMREWMAAFERAMGDTAHDATQAAAGTQSAAGGQQGQGRGAARADGKTQANAKGTQHGR
ncbi:hypothetical protein ACFSHT_22015 [Paraburkholderia silviterrae]|uniref:Phasin domain-containing protein n=1 Tax=Paraburkholderia silviterrae TaxID=2528715 RepID=A0A4R5MFW3_9BURK|nr:hypothetical protein [Paraburkholderia silviterrae]TDG25927.1 hypothetical protein EYW47_00750 [Paraburkholderia silviterrae]